MGLFNERKCFKHDAKPENLACHRLPLVISFIQSNIGHLAGFFAVFIVRTRPEGQKMHFFKNTLTK